MVALQVPLPTSLKTSNVYSPLSLFSVDKIFRIELLSVLCTLYFLPVVSSFPSLCHLTVRGFVPENLHSRVAGSPAVTLIDLAGSVIFAGSRD